MNRYDILLEKKPPEEPATTSFLGQDAESRRIWNRRCNLPIPPQTPTDLTDRSIVHGYPRATGVTELRGQTNQMVHLDDPQFSMTWNPADLTAVQEEAITAEYQRAIDAIAENISRNGGLVIDNTGTSRGGGLIIDTSPVRNSQGLITEIIPARNLTHEQHRMLYAGMSRVARETGIIMTVGGQRIGQIQSWEPSPSPSIDLARRHEQENNLFREAYFSTPVEAPETTEPAGGRAIQWPPDMTVRLSQEISRGIRPPTPEMLQELGLIRGEQESETDFLSRFNRAILRTPPEPAGERYFQRIQ